MIFNSFQFLAFFAVVCPLYWLLPFRVQRLFLLAASYAFYMAWRAHYALLLVASTVTDYLTALGLERCRERPRVRKLLLLVSLCVNLGLLFTFKYWGFFGDGAQALGQLFGSPIRWPALDVLLPVGISFYTFQTLSYTIDVYRGRVPAQRSLIAFALYVSFFPQLVAGPIERASTLLPQFLARRGFDVQRLLHGLRLVVIGYYKKMVVGDNLARIVDSVYAAGAPEDAVAYCVGTYAFAFQIYADFSGYSDIAVGVAKILGFDLMANFNAPYLARSPVEFWRRWHISLSSWLRDYLYVPLGGNRKGRLRTYANLIITMLLGGLWHGAGWNFVVWGALNGAYLAVTKAADGFWNAAVARLRIPRQLLTLLGIFVTFHLIALSWIYFRAPTIGQANLMAATIGNALLTGQLWSSQALDRWAELLSETATVWRLTAGLLVLDLWIGSGLELDRFYRAPMLLRYAAYSLLVLLTLTFGVFGAQEFIYFQF